MRSRLLRLLLGTTAALVLLPALAHGATGTIKGRVLNKKTGQPEGFVEVFLEGPGSPTPLVEFSDDAGQFVFSGVQAGIWTKLYASKTGLFSDQLTNIELTSGQTRELTLYLSDVKAIEDKVDVRARTKGKIDTRTSSTKEGLTGDFIRNIPLQNKDLTSLVFLMPGVSRAGGSDSTEISVAGGTSNQIGYRLGGVSFNDVVSGGPAADISTAAIERFELIRGGFQAQYGQQSTGIAEIITKTGTNKVEFSYAATYRDTSFDDNLFGRAIDTASLGILDGITSAVPDLEETQDIVNRIANGLTDPFTAGSLIQHFGYPPSTREDDNNPVPRLRIQHQLSAGGPIKRDKVFFFTAVDILQSDTGSAFTDGVTQSDQISLFGKVNWELRTGHKMWVEANFQTNEDDPGDAVFVMDDEDILNPSNRGVYTANFHDKHIFEAKDGFLKDSFLENIFTIIHQYSTNRPPSNEVGRITNILLPPGGTFALNEGTSNVNYDRHQTTYRLATTFSKNLESHVLQFGGELNYTKFGGLQEVGQSLSDNRIINGVQPGRPPLGNYGSVTDYGPAVRAELSNKGFYVYLQDTWSISRVLTLDMGARMDWQEFVNKLLIAPRVGFSLDPVGNSKTRFFGSWGHFYDDVLLSTLDQALQPTLTQSNVYPGRGDYRKAEFDEIDFEDLYTLALSGSPNDDDSIAYVLKEQELNFDVDEDLTSPKNVSWQLGLTRSLPGGLTLQVDYTEAERDNQIGFYNDTVYVPPPGSTLPTQVVNYLSSQYKEEYRGWSVTLQKSFSKRWDMFLSYTQQSAKGPVTPPADPLDPIGSRRSVYAVLGRDQTHIAKAQFNFELPWKLRMAASFRYQTGTPESPFYVVPLPSVDSAGNIQQVYNRVYPLGINSIRLPDDRALDLTITRAFKPKKYNADMETRVSIFNVTNEYNVFSGQGYFEPYENVNPANNPPLRPAVLPLGIDIGRTVEFEFRLRF